MDKALYCMIFLSLIITNSIYIGVGIMKKDRIVVIANAMAVIVNVGNIMLKILGNLER